MNNAKNNLLLVIAISALLVSLPGTMNPAQRHFCSGTLKSIDGSYDGLVNFKKILACLKFEGAYYAANMGLRESWESAYLDLRGRGADFNTPDPNLGITPLHLACKNNNVYLIKFLLRDGVNFMAKDCTGKTPLHYACLYNAYLAAYLLAEHGAYLTLDKHGHSPLSIAQLLRNDLTEIFVKSLPNISPNTIVENRLNKVMSCEKDQSKSKDDDDIPALVEFLINNQ